jgi:hypothetical protein
LRLHPLCPARNVAHAQAPREWVIFPTWGFRCPAKDMGHAQHVSGGPRQSRTRSIPALAGMTGCPACKNPPFVFRSEKIPAKPTIKQSRRTLALCCRVSDPSVY